MLLRDILSAVEEIKKNLIYTKSLETKWKKEEDRFPVIIKYIKKQKEFFEDEIEKVNLLDFDNNMLSDFIKNRNFTNVSLLKEKEVDFIEPGIVDKIKEKSKEVTKESLEIKEKEQQIEAKTEIEPCLKSVAKVLPEQEKITATKKEEELLSTATPIQKMEPEKTVKSETSAIITDKKAEAILSVRNKITHPIDSKTPETVTREEKQTETILPTVEKESKIIEKELVSERLADNADNKEVAELPLKEEVKSVQPPVDTIPDDTFIDEELPNTLITAKLETPSVAEIKEEPKPVPTVKEKKAPKKILFLEGDEPEPLPVVKPLESKTLVESEIKPDLLIKSQEINSKIESEKPLPTPELQQTIFPEKTEIRQAPIAESQEIIFPDEQEHTVKPQPSASEKDISRHEPIDIFPTEILTLPEKEKPQQPTEKKPTAEPVKSISEEETIPIKLISKGQPAAQPRYVKDKTETDKKQKSQITPVQKKVDYTDVSAPTTILNEPAAPVQKHLDSIKNGKLSDDFAFAATQILDDIVTPKDKPAGEPTGIIDEKKLASYKSLRKLA
ncbi:MAG: hypothetical protein ABIH42_05115, partial [Planctomycetota bacterium]